MTCTVILFSYRVGPRRGCPRRGPRARGAAARGARRARPCPPRSSARAGRRPSPATPSPARARPRPAGGGPLRRTRRCPSAAHYRRPGPLRAAREAPGSRGRGGSDRGSARTTLPAMPTATSKQRVALIDQMAAEWRSIGRSRPAVRALRDVAGRDPGLALLVLGPDRPSGPPPCPTPCDLVDHMRRASGRVQREEAARLVRVLLREADADPFICRMLVQALVPGLVTVAGKLQWGRGGDWQDGEEFFGELLSTTWFVLQEWSGQDRPYAVLDLLSAIRCRLRRQLFRSKDLAADPPRSVPTWPRRVPRSPGGDRPRGAGPHPHRPARRGHATRRGPGALRPPRPRATPWPSWPP